MFAMLDVCDTSTDKDFLNAKQTQKAPLINSHSTPSLGETKQL